MPAHLKCCLPWLLLCGAAMPLAWPGATAEPSGDELPTELGPHWERVRRHFGEDARVMAQRAAHPEGGTSVLLYTRQAGMRPVLFRLSSTGHLEWLSEVPLSGVRDYVYLPRIAPGPENSVLLVWKGTDPRGISARLLDAAGKARWTRPLLPDDAEYVDAVRWGEHGWAVAASSFDRVIVQRVDPQGQAQWNPALTLVERRMGMSPISLLIDSPESVFALWYDYGEPRDRSDNTFRAQRISLAGKPMWVRPAVVGPAADYHFAPPPVVKLELGRGGVIAHLHRGVVDDVVGRQVQHYRRVVTPQGAVLPQEEPPR